MVHGVVTRQYLPARLSEGGAGWRWRRDLQRLQLPNISAVSAANVVVGGPDVLGGQHADRGQREVFVLGFPGGCSGAQGVPLPADGTLVQLDHALAAEPVARLSAPTAKVMARAPRFVAHGARFPRSAWVGGLARGHPKESIDREQGSAGSEARAPWLVYRNAWCGAMRVCGQRSPRFPGGALICWLNDW